MTNKNSNSDIEKPAKQKYKMPFKAISITLICVFILSLSAYLLVVNFWQPYNSYTQAKELLENKSLTQAIEKLEALNGFWDSEQLIDTSYALLIYDKLQCKQYDKASESFLNIVDVKNPKVIEITEQIKSEADNYFTRMSYENAYYYYSAIGLKSESMRCVETQYQLLTSLCTSVCGIPEGFDIPMLAGYKDVDKYVLAYSLETSAWATEQEIEKNIELCYELGDFLNTSKHGFIVHRLFTQRFSNNDGYYFSMDKLGNLKYNIPGYKLPGYYGLYTKFNEGVVYIGSDEKQSWTNQFRFEFSDMDNTLKIYSFAANRSYILTKDI